MKEFLDDNFIPIILLISIIAVIALAINIINRQYEFKEKLMDHAIQTNSTIVIK